MGTRHPDRDMMNSLASFEAYVKMIEKALTNDKTKVRKLLEMKEKVETFYFNFNQTYHLYKADIISKEKKILKNPIIPLIQEKTQQVKRNSMVLLLNILKKSKV